MKRYDSYYDQEIAFLRCKDYDNSRALRKHPHDDGKVTFAWAMRRAYVPLFLGEYQDHVWEEVIVGRSCKIYHCSTALVDDYVTLDIKGYKSEEQHREEGKEYISLIPGIALCGLSVEPFSGSICVESRNECLIWGDVKLRPIKFHGGRRYNRLVRKFNSTFIQAIVELQWDSLDGLLYLA